MINNILFVRFLFFFLLLFCVVFCPLFLTMGLFVLGASLFGKYWEGILVGFFLDALYLSPPLFSVLNFGFFTLLFLATILFVNWLKGVIQGYNILADLLLSIFGGAFVFVVFLIFV